MVKKYGGAWDREDDTMGGIVAGGGASSFGAKEGIIDRLKRELADAREKIAWLRAGRDEARRELADARAERDQYLEEEEIRDAHGALGEGES